MSRHGAARGEAGRGRTWLRSRQPMPSGSTLATLWAFQRRPREGIRLGSLGLAPQDGGHLHVGPIATASGEAG
jgi:hypothetical protein